MRVGMIGHRRDSDMTNCTLISVGPTGMAIVTMLDKPTGRMGTGVTRDYPSMANATLLSIRRTRMAVVAVLGKPTGPMRVGMPGHSASPPMTDTAGLRLRGTRVTTVAMLILPTGRMRIGMGSYGRFMTHRASRPRTLAGMTV